MIVMPAYGRRYPSAAAAVKDWDSGKDFRILRGPYCSVRDSEMLVRDFGHVMIWWNYPCVPAAAQYVDVAGERNLLDKLLGLA